MPRLVQIETCFFGIIHCTTSFHLPSIHLSRTLRHQLVDVGGAGGGAGGRLVDLHLRMDVPRRYGRLNEKRFLS